MQLQWQKLIFAQHRAQNTYLVQHYSMSVALKQHGAHLSMQLSICIQEPPHSLLLVQRKIVPSIVKVIQDWSCLGGVTFTAEILQDSSASSSAHELSSHEPLLMSGPASCKARWRTAQCVDSLGFFMALQCVHPTYCLNRALVAQHRCSHTVHGGGRWFRVLLETSPFCCIPVNCARVALLNAQLGMGGSAWASSDGLPVRGFDCV